MAVLLLAMTLAAALSFQVPGTVHLLAEEGAGARVEDRGFGVVALRGSQGWLRMAGVYGDFTLTFAFRDLTADADAAVVVRSWTGLGGWPGTGYRVPLSSAIAAARRWYFDPAIVKGKPVPTVVEIEMTFKLK